MSVYFDGKVIRQSGIGNEREVLAKRVVPGKWEDEPHGGAPSAYYHELYDRALVEHVEDELRKWSKGQLLSYCRWADPNGDWEEPPPIEREYLEEVILDWVKENMMTPGEMRRYSRRDLRRGRRPVRRAKRKVPRSRALKHAYASSQKRRR